MGWDDGLGYSHSIDFGNTNTNIGLHGRWVYRLTSGCGSFVCQNGGTCSVGSSGDNQCACAVGWEGSQCEIGEKLMVLNFVKIYDMTSTSIFAKHTYLYSLYTLDQRATVIIHLSVCKA